MAIFPGSAIPSAVSDYTIDQSLRFNDNDSDYLSRTFSAGDTTSWTFSCWVKRGNDVASGVDGSQKIFGAMIDGSNVSDINFSTDDIMDISEYVGGSTVARLKTEQLFRDFSAWYHIVVVWDSDNGSSGDRYRLYVNGDRVTAFSTETEPSSAQASATNAAGTHNVGKQDSDEYYDGYLAEMYFIDGQSLDADSFAETDSDTNQWKPIDASGLTFGTNGFYQKYAATELANSFTDSSEATSFTPTEALTVNCLVVAGGGGGGGGSSPGGGGGGGVVHNSSLSLTADTGYGVTVGSGGSGGSSGNRGINGSDSVFGSITAVGGGGGGTRSNSEPANDGKNGGSGGGGGTTTGNGHVTTGGSATQGDSGGGTGYGNAGGTGVHISGSYEAGGGGGGSDAAGQNSQTATGGNGGDGKTFTIYDGSSIAYAGGGGSSGNDFGSGGAGGGGDPGSSGTANTGGGGGSGRGPTDTPTTGGNGGSGIVIVSYISTTEKATGGTITSYADGGNTYQVHTFTTSRSAHTITANGGVTQTRAVKKVGDSSIVFDGTGDYLSLASSSDWNFGTGEWTIENWVYQTATTNSGAIGAISSWGVNGAIQIWGETSSGNTTVSFKFKDSGGTTRTLTHQSTFAKDTWVHIAAVRSSNTVTLYLGGVASTSTYDATGESMGVTQAAYIGTQYNDTSYALEGYMDEIRISDSARYTTGFTPSTTEFTADANTLLLIHSNWDGGLGLDSSGNENDFAATNLVATDKMVDSPTNNFCTWNGICKDTNATLSEGNLELIGTAHYGASFGTIGEDSGKWYWETLVVNSLGAYIGTGIAKETATDAVDTIWAGGTDSISYYPDGNIYNNGSSTSSSMPTYAVGDIIGVAIDLENSKLYFSKNNSWINSGDPTSGATGTGSVATPASVGWMPLAHGSTSSGGYVANFGQDSSFAGNETAQGNQDDNDIGDFYYEPPTDYLALCTDNLPDPEIALPGDNFNTILRNGTYPSGGSFTGVGFQPDLLWQKPRNLADSHYLTDSVRGVSKIIKSDTIGLEQTDTNWVTSFDSDGFTMGSTDWETSTTVVDWNWKAGGAVSTPSANAEAGFSIATGTGTGSQVATNHGLGVTPEVVIWKNLSADSHWFFWWSGFSNLTSYTLFLETNAATTTTGFGSVFGTINATSASILTGGVTSGIGSGDDFVMYSFASIEGYSKIGSYDGNNDNDGSFLYLGFRPAYVMVKSTTATANWAIEDNKRNTYNQQALFLQADTSDDEATNGYLDFLSNGIKFRNTNADFNDAQTYLYMAFAESPFKYANAR